MSNLYIPVSHTNGRSLKKTVGVAVNRLVGMGLNRRSKALSELGWAGFREILVPVVGRSWSFSCSTLVGIMISKRAHS